MTGLYIHIPFCVSRCRYCDFYRETDASSEQVQYFLKALDREFERLPDGFAPNTVFIGGGTPTVLSADEYARMLELVHRHIDLSNVVEFTSEANPGTLTQEKLAVMRRGGIDRVSIGVQTFNQKALRLLGRIHDAQEAVDGYHMLRNAGFDNVNIDMIQSIAGMSPDDVLADAQQVVDLGPEHVSYYNLIYEDGTPITQDLDAGRIREPGEDEEADNYFAVRDLLGRSGYEQYEISNFSRAGKRCEHNVLYWQGGAYLGCGPAAHSHWNGKRFGNLPDLKVYCDRLELNQRPFDEIEVLNSEDKARETLVMWLRMVEGVDRAKFRDSTGFLAEALCGPSLPLLLDEGLLSLTAEHLALAPQALFISNAIFSDLI